MQNVEYGYEWITEHIVETEGELVDVDEPYRDLLDECYSEVKLGDLTYSPSLVLELVDPTAFRIGAGEYADSIVEDGRLIEFAGRYYRMHPLLVSSKFSEHQCRITYYMK